MMGRTSPGYADPLCVAYNGTYTIRVIPATTYTCTAVAAMRSSHTSFEVIARGVDEPFGQRPNFSALYGTILHYSFEKTINSL